MKRLIAAGFFLLLLTLGACSDDAAGVIGSYRSRSARIIDAGRWGYNVSFSQPGIDELDRAPFAREISPVYGRLLRTKRSRPCRR